MPKIAFVLEDFVLPTPSQQLLDRLLIGYPRDGEFHKPTGLEIIATAHGDLSKDGAALLEKRKQERGLRLMASLPEAVAAADHAVVVWRGGGAAANDGLLQQVLGNLKPGGRCFVHGVLGSGLEAARKALTVAAERGVSLMSGSSTAVTLRLPQVDLPQGAALKEALVVVQGPFPQGEYDALEGLLPVLERRKGGESGIEQIAKVDAAHLWTGQPAWSGKLLAAAVSRSNNILGDPQKDGRTQDVVGLGLLPKLAKEPRAWTLRHKDGLRTTLLVLNGALADYNFAVETTSGRIYSAQLYRSQSPMQEHFSHLAAAVEEFLIGARPRWSTLRSLEQAEALERMSRLSA